MKFGERLLSSQHPPWSENYINYLRLKQLLNPLFNLEPSLEDGVGVSSSPNETASVRLGYDASSASLSTLHQDVGGVHSNDGTGVSSSHSFQKELNYEIQKALLFLMKSMGELASDLSTLSDQQRLVSINAQSLVDENEHSKELQQHQQEPLKTAIQQQLQNIDLLRMEYLVRIGSKLLLLLEFVELNIEAIVKIVKKHDKLLSKWEESRSANQRHSVPDKPRYTRLRRQYLPRFAIYSPDPNVRCLFLAAADAGDCSRDKGSGRPLQQLSAMRQSQSDGNFGGWDVMQWNLEVALRELFKLDRDLRSILEECSADNMKEEAVAPSLHSFQSLSSRSFSEIPPLSDGNASPVKNFLNRSYSFFGLATSVNSHSQAGNGATFFEPIIYQIQSSRWRLGQMHSRYIRMVYAHEMLHLIDDTNIQKEDENYRMQRRETFGTLEDLEKVKKISVGNEDEGKKLMKPYPTVSRLSKILNLTSAGLYMMNYNIVAPTSGLYAELLGFDKANAGIIIGMTPAAVILSAVLYSWWSSYSYKRALMFASFCCLVGNIVYALALPFGSLKMVLLGRILTGFGSARVINRRYIADYYSIEDRTSGMADFVSASALGMALGPGLAASLSIVAPDGGDTSSYWTIETAPGYVMFVLWSIYLTCNILFFEEPERGHYENNTLAPSQNQSIGGATGPSESSPLLNGTKVVKPVHSLVTSCGNIPVLISLMLLVLLKSVLEGISSSAPTVSMFYFGWGVHASGIYLAVLASFVLPTNFVVAFISRKYDDRELILGALGFMLVGILGFLVYGDGYSETQFICFGLVAFVACNSLEGPTMGLLSKTIPKSLARGIFNAGLLATEAGTLGRVIGDFWLSSAAFMGLDQMLNRTFEPMCAMVGVSIFATLWGYSYLQPRFEDEDDD